MRCETCHQTFTTKACPRCSSPAASLGSSLVLAMFVGLGAGGCNEPDDGESSTDDVVPDAGADEYAGPDNFETDSMFMDESSSDTSGESSSDTSDTSSDTTGDTSSDTSGESTT